jgi:type IV secretion system protein VirB3
MSDANVTREVVFTALTRPQMFAGVTYNFFILNLIVGAELFLLFKTAWVLGIAIVLHAFGMVACLREPRIFDLWLTRVRRCPRVKNYGLWGCNSYRP